MRTAGICLMLILLLVACTPWRSEYLAGAVNTASQDDVVKRMGPPHSTHKLESGETVWGYRSAGVMDGQSYCSEYVLTFDTKRTLRSWNKQRC